MQIRGLFAGAAALAMLALVGCGAKSGTGSGDASQKKTDSGAEKKTGSGAEAKPGSAKEKGAAPALTADVKAYALETCLVSGKSVDPECALEHEGQQYKFCCKKCAGKFKDNPAKCVAKYAETIAAKK